MLFGSLAAVDGCERVFRCDPYGGAESLDGLQRGAILGGCAPCRGREAMGMGADWLPVLSVPGDPFGLCRCRSGPVAAGEDPLVGALLSHRLPDLGPDILDYDLEWRLGRILAAYSDICTSIPVLFSQSKRKRKALWTLTTRRSLTQSGLWWGSLNNRRRQR